MLLNFPTEHGERISVNVNLRNITVQAMFALEF